MSIAAVLTGKTLTLTIDLDTPTPSASGKTMVHASSRGNITLPIIVGGKPLVLGLNIYTSNK